MPEVARTQKPRIYKADDSFEACVEAGTPGIATRKEHGMNGRLKNSTVLVAVLLATFVSFFVGVFVAGLAGGPAEEVVRSDTQSVPTAGSSRAAEIVKEVEAQPVSSPILFMTLLTTPLRARAAEIVKEVEADADVTPEVVDLLRNGDRYDWLSENRAVKTLLCILVIKKASTSLKPGNVEDLASQARQLYLFLNDWYAEFNQRDTIADLVSIHIAIQNRVKELEEPAEAKKAVDALIALRKELDASAAAREASKQ